MKFFIILAAGFVFSLLFPRPLFAHAFGQLYNLPVPFWMYLYGGAAVVILSFIIVSLFIQEKKKLPSFPTRSLSKMTDIVLHPGIVKLGKAASLLLLFLTILTGLVGRNDMYSNFNMTFFWVIFLLGTTYTVGFFGNYWSAFNPLKILARFGSKFIGEGIFPYPKRLGYYPALLTYILLIWIELFFQNTPLTLSLMLLQYLVVTLVFSFLFGIKNWFCYAEFFQVFFRLIGLMGVFIKKYRTLTLRLPFTGILDYQPDHLSLLFFIIFMLSSTAYDGISSTVFWDLQFLTPLTVALQPVFGGYASLVIQTLGMFLVFAVFLLVFTFCIWISKIISQSPISLSALLMLFSTSLLPIAFVYNIAHYFTLLVTEGQNMLRIISDPLGFGWNLFRTKSSSPLFIPDATTVWHMQVGILLAGHIAGVFLTHLLAISHLQGKKHFFLSQLPLLTVMVFYTIVGLWILSQPIAPGA